MLLTVAMPVFNNERYLAAAVESVLGQSYPEFELLLCDDGSTDQTLAIARHYAKVDNRVRVLSHPNLGICNNMNDAIAHGRGEWIACMHGDDVMLPRRLERQIGFLQANPDIDLTSCLVHWIDDRDRIVGYSRCHLTTRDAVKGVIANDGVLAFPHPGAAFRKSVVQAVGGYRPMAFPTEDVDLWNRIADAGYGVLVQPEVLLRYRVHSNSTSTTKAKRVMRNLRWVEACVHARHHGKPEPTLEQFLAARREAGLLRRLDDERIDAGHAAYQNAINHYASSRYHLMAPSMLAALLLRPGLFLPRLLARVTGQSNGKAA
jgi:glycosyltransferase involved in cell wall biosynthesis